jgi:hypothetical protein
MWIDCLIFFIVTRTLNPEQCKNSVFIISKPTDMSLTFDLEGQVITEHHRFANLNNDIQRYCEQLPTFDTWPTFWALPVTFDL